MTAGPSVAAAMKTASTPAEADIAGDAETGEQGGLLDDHGVDLLSDERKPGPEGRIRHHRKLGQPNARETVPRLSS